MLPAVKYIRNVAIIVLALWSLAGCIREDNSDCPRGICVLFSPENPKHIYPELVRTLDLYIYNLNGELALKRHFESADLRPGDRAALITNGLPTGDYTLVALVNDVEEYVTVGEQHLSELQSYFREPFANYRLTDFFSGMMDISVTGGSGLQVVNLPIIKHNNDFQLQLKFEGYVPFAGSTLITHLKDEDGMYHYQSGGPIRKVHVDYDPYNIDWEQQNYPVAFIDFSIMRLWRGGSMAVSIAEGPDGDSVTFNLVDALATLSDENTGELLYDTDKKLSYNDEYVLVITLGPDLVVLDISISNWHHIVGDTDI